MTTELAIETSHLTARHGSVTVLEGVDLAVPRGTVFSLLGPNGAGKTTTVRILSTLLRAKSGTARVAGYDVVTQRDQVRQRISLTGQDTSLDEQLTGRENLQMMGRLRRLPRRQARARAQELIEQFDLVEAADRLAGTYSGGMRRRLDLAAGLVARPEVVFLDEPTTGLDPRGRQDMWDVIAGLARSGVTIFLTTQYLEEADRLAQSIALLDGGRIVAMGTAAELKARVSRQRLDVSLVHADAYAAVADHLGGRVVHSDRSRLTLGVAVDGEANEIRRLLDELDPDGCRIGRFALHGASLDDVFLTLTGSNTAARESETTHV